MTQPVTRPESDPLDALTTSERECFEALAPFVGAASQSPADAAWLADCVTRHPPLRPVLAQHQALRTELRQRYAPLPDDIGLRQAKARIAALPRQSAGIARTSATPPTQPGWTDRLRAWLQPSPAWAMALTVLILPLAFLAGRETAAPDYAAVRSTAKGLFDGPLLRVSYQPQTSEQVIRDLLLAQGAVVVGPTRLGDWFVKVAPDRVEAVRAALTKSSAVVAAEIVPTLPSELVDQP